VKATVWGCRGSLATPGPTTVRYGGNTSCVHVQTASGKTVVLDAGTGIRPLGVAVAAAGVRRIELLLTHLHLDHVEGLGFFAPLFDADTVVTVHGPRPDGSSLASWIATYLSPPFFPLPFEEIPARVEFVEVWHEQFVVDGVAVTAAPVAHPGRTLGYRLEESGHTLAFVPDNEPGIDPHAATALAAGVDVLFHDAQYTAGEYESRVGWGHASLPDFSRVVREAEPRSVVMFHHDPSHSDDDLERMEEEARSLCDRDDVRLAREGLEVDVA
jgi:phosphoribosyl 1,2-cyclic phosphodiesterase